MSDVEALINLTQNPFSLMAGALTLFAATRLLQEIKKPKGKSDDGLQRNSDEIKCLTDSVRNINDTSKEILKTLSEVVSQASDNDECVELLQSKLENVSGMVGELIRMHRDPNSSFATVKISDKLEKIADKQNDIEVVLARMK